MHAAFGDRLFAFVEHNQLWLSPTYYKQADWWQITLDLAHLRQYDLLDYVQTLVTAYLKVHPAEEQRVGRTQIVTVILRVLDTLN